MTDTKPKSRAHLWKKGQSGNPNGRPKGGSSVAKRTAAQLNELSDLHLQRKLLRAIITADMETLAEFSITKTPSDSLRVKASSDLVKINMAIKANEEKFLADQKAAEEAAAKKPQQAQAQFSSSTVTNINKASA